MKVALDGNIIFLAAGRGITPSHLSVLHFKPITLCLMRLNLTPFFIRGPNILENAATTSFKCPVNACRFEVRHVAMCVSPIVVGDAFASECWPIC